MTPPRKPRSSVRDYRVAPGQGDGPENVHNEAPGPFTPVSFVVPGKPLSVNRANRPVARRGMTMVLKTDDWEEYAPRFQAAARQAMRGRPMLQGDLAFTIVAYWPRRNADSDGPLKPAKDLCQGIVYANDSQVSGDLTDRQHDPVNPRVVVTITPRPPVVERVMDAEGLRALFVDEMGEG